MKKIKLFLVLLSVLASYSAFSQNITVTGTVKDSSTGEPVPFAAIQLKDTMIGGMADTDGVYSIDVPASGGLWYSYKGVFYRVCYGSKVGRYRKNSVI